MRRGAGHSSPENSEIFRSNATLGEFSRPLNNFFTFACNNNQVNDCSTTCLKCIYFVLCERHEIICFQSISVSKGEGRIRPNPTNLPWIRPLIGNIMRNILGLFCVML